jgi:hypothetical protein
VQVADGIHRLTPAVCNFYLIEDGGTLALVDAGAPATGSCWSEPLRPWVAGSRTWTPC